MPSVITKLPQSLTEQLQGQTIVLLNVVEPASGDIYSTALSWVIAASPSVIRFAIDAKSEFVRILKNDPRLLLTFTADQSVFSIKGKAAVKVDKTEELTLKMALIEVQIEEIRDIIFYGGKITALPEFVKTYNPELVKKLDDEVKQALIGLA